MLQWECGQGALGEGRLAWPDLLREQERDA